jgi:hypothetical protein
MQELLGGQRLEFQDLLLGREVREQCDFDRIDGLFEFFRDLCECECPIERHAGAGGELALDGRDPKRRFAHFGRVQLRGDLVVATVVE